jgi:tetratricopeptide (TPR) repeat protein
VWLLKRKKFLLKSLYIVKQCQLKRALLSCCFLIFALELQAQEVSNPCIAELPATVQGSFLERQSKFKSILDKCPGLVEAHYNFAVLLLENKETASAVVQFEEALKLRDEPEYRLGLASALFAKGDLLTAKSHYETLLSKDPRSLRALLGMATVLEKSDKQAEALDYLNRAYAVEPENIFVNYNLGVLYDRLAQSDAAIISFERALKTNQNHFPSQFYLGLALKKAGKEDEALSALKKASELPDASVEGIRAYALELEESGSLDESEIVLRRSLSHHPAEQKLMEQMAIILLRKKQESNAKPFIEQLLVKTPGESRLLGLYGWTQLRLGDLISAEKSLKEAVIRDSANAFAFFALGELYRQSGQLELSKTNFDTAYNLEPSLKEKSVEWWKFW